MVKRVWKKELSKRESGGGVNGEMQRRVRID